MWSLQSLTRSRTATSGPVLSLELSWWLSRNSYYATLQMPKEKGLPIGKDVPTSPMSVNDGLISTSPLLCYL